MSPEALNLFLACARLQLDRQALAVIDAFAPAEIDWASFLLEARNHGMAPLMNRHLGSDERVPAKVRTALWARYEHAVRRNKAMAHELLRILAAFRSAGVLALPYKGPALAAGTYGDLGLREFEDLDILVRPRDMAKASDVLASIGYSPVFMVSSQLTERILRSAVHYDLIFHAGDVTVELHWRTDPVCAVERDDEAWWSALRRTRLLEKEVPALGADDHLLVLALHGSKHRWRTLGWLVDLAEILRADRSLDGASVAARARELGAERRLYLGLRLARDLLRAPIPAALAAGCDRKDVLRLAVIVGREIFAPPSVGIFGELAGELALYERPRDKLRHAWRCIAPGYAEWARYPLPRPLFFLYFPLRLARLAAKHLFSPRSPRSQAAATPRTPPPRPHSTG